MKASVRPSAESAGSQSLDRTAEGTRHSLRDGRQSSLLAAFQRQQEKPGELAFGLIRDYQPLVVGGPCDTGVPARNGRDVGQASFGPPERWDHVDPWRALVRLAQERDEAAVRGPGRAVVPGWIPGEAQRFAWSNQLPVDVVVVLLLPVPGEGDLVSVGRERGLDLEAGRSREWCGHRGGFRCLNLGAAPGPGLGDDHEYGDGEAGRYQPVEGTQGGVRRHGELP